MIAASLTLITILATGFIYSRVRYLIFTRRFK